MMIKYILCMTHNNIWDNTKCISPFSTGTVCRRPNLYEVYIVCSRPLIPDTASEMLFTKCAVGPLSLTLPQRWCLQSVQSALHPWHCLRDDVYKVCSGPLIPDRWSLPVCNQPLLRIRLSQCTMSSSPPPPPLGDEIYLLCSGPLISSEI